MRELDTNKPGIKTIVDDDIAELLKYAHLGAAWSKTTKAYYVSVRSANKTMQLARIIIDVPEGMQVDHINGDPLDNRRENLRAVTRTQNLQNRRGWSKTGYKGVRYLKARAGKGRACYEARINVDKVRLYLGRSDTAEGAARMYDAAAKEHFGEYAALNFE